MDCFKNYCRFGFLERPLNKLNKKHATVVANHPWPFIIIPLLISSGLGVGFFFKTEAADPFVMFTPQTGPALKERATIKRLFPPSDGNYVPSRSIAADGELFLIVASADGGNVLSGDFRKAVKRLNDYVSEEMSVTLKGIEYGYMNICLKLTNYCHQNPQLYAIDYLLTNPSPSDNFTYPTARHGERQFYVGSVLGDVRLDPLSRQIIEAKAWQLIYRIKTGDQLDAVSELWRRQFEYEMLNYPDKRLTIYVYHYLSLNLELKRNGENITPKFIICVLTLLSFVVACSMIFTRRSGVLYIDWTLSKPIVAAAGLMGAVMGVATTIGILSFCQYPYNTVVDAMPFVVIGVRLDNTFLMIAAVQNTKRSTPFKDRIIEAMSEAAVSILITVLTDILSFAAGIFTDFIAVQLFSVYILIAMAITYVYQLTFLLGILVLSMKAEEENKHALCSKYPTINIDSEKTATSSMIKRFFCSGTHRASSGPEVPDTEIDRRTWITRMIETYYAPFLMKTSTRIVVLVIYVGYLAISIFGCYQMRQGLEISRLLVKDSYASQYCDQVSKYFWANGVQCQVVFAEPGDITDKKNRDQILHIVNELANSDHGTGSDGIDFWLTTFQTFVENNYNVPLDILSKHDFIQYLQFFLSMDENAQYRNDIHWNNATAQDEIKAFRLMLGLQNFSNAPMQIDTVDQLRAICAKYRKFQVSTFELMWLFVDQYEAVLPNTLQEIYCGISFMILIAATLIPSLTCSLWVVVAILSIDAGTIGLMTFWGINMDVISMVCIILSIGFSVDFTAHIAYAFVVNHGRTAAEKTKQALGALAWPIVQGGVSTLMGVVVLAGDRSYIQDAFFKTVFIVIILGLTHGLVFLPVILSIFTTDILKCFHKAKPEVEMTASFSSVATPNGECVPDDPKLE